MTTAYARGTRRTSEVVSYNLERKLPALGKIYAKLGDEVKPETVIGECKVSAGFRVFRLGELLGVPPAKAQHFLRRTIGSKVYQGDIIAEANKLLGLRSVQFIAPVDGILQNLNPTTGQLTLQFAPVTYRLPAGVNGKISQIHPDESVSIQTTARLLSGAFVAGGMREGALHIIAPPDQPIQPQTIDARLSGHIIAGGSMVSKDVLNRCLAIGVKGIVCGGIAAHDLLEISGALNSQEDIGITLLITSGMGNMAMETDTYQFLETHQEQQVYLVPQQKMLVAPVAATEAATVPASSAPVGYLPLTEGATVRVLSDPARGSVATVKQLLPPQALPGSRFEVEYCLLQPSTGDTIQVPITNLEVIA